MGSIIKAILIVGALLISFVTFALSGSFSGPVNDAEQQATAAVILARMTPSPLPTAANSTPTMSFYDFSGTQVAQQQSIALTSQAQQQAYELQKQKAEQAAQNSKSTADAAAVTAQAHQEQMTAQARATFMQATAAAQATFIQSTAYAQATSTEQALIISNNATSTSAARTAVVQPTSDLLTLQAARVIQTIEAGQAKQVELQVQAQTATNYLKAFMWPAIIIALTYVAARGFAEYVKTRVHTRDEHGRVPLLQMKSNSGDTIIFKPENLETGLVKVSKDGDVIRYAPMDKQEQSDINRRTQAVEAIAALPVPYAQQGPKMLGNEFGRNMPRVSYHTENDRARTTVLDEADSQFLEGSDE